MTENDLLFQISNIVNGHASFAQAVQRIASLLEREAGGRALILDQTNAAEVLDSFDEQYRSLYTVELRGGGEALGKVTLCFASDRPQGDLPRRLSDFVGEQLGMLLARTHLADRRTHLRREIENIEQDLANRKLMQRAEGILIAKRDMEQASAKRWIAQQSQKTGLSKEDVADRIIAYHQATGLEQRIA